MLYVYIMSKFTLATGYGDQDQEGGGVHGASSTSSTSTLYAIDSIIILIRLLLLCFVVVRVLCVVRVTCVLFLNTNQRTNVNAVVCRILMCACRHFSCRFPIMCGACLDL